MTWIETADGFVNLATALLIDRTGRDQAWIYDGRGKSHEILYPKDIEDYLYPVLPSFSKCLLYYLYLDDDDTVYEEMYPIVGWQIIGDYRKAIAPGNMLENDRSLWLIGLPNNKFLANEYDGAYFETLEPAKKLLRERVKIAEDVRQQQQERLETSAKDA